MIRFEKVVKSYASGARPALRDIDLHITQGQFAYLVGASGSGKSTVIRLLLREEVATSGCITVAGRDLSAIRRREIPRLRRDLGVVFQDFRLLPDKNVYDNVAYVLHVLGATSQAVRKSVPQTLDVVGLTGLSRRLPHELSGGEQQRVAIARALVKRPQLLLADEPTGNLDPGTSLEIVGLLMQINEAGTTVLMATHDDSIVNQIRRRVIQLDAGRIVRDEAGGAYDAPRPVVQEPETDGQEPRADATVKSASPSQGASLVLTGAASAGARPAAQQYGEYEDDEPIDWPRAPRPSRAQHETPGVMAQAPTGQSSDDADAVTAHSGSRPDQGAVRVSKASTRQRSPRPDREAAARQARTVQRLGRLWSTRGRQAQGADDVPGEQGQRMQERVDVRAEDMAGDRAAGDAGVDPPSDPPQGNPHDDPAVKAETTRPSVAQVRR